MPRDVPPDKELHDLIVAATLAPLHWLRARTTLEDAAPAVAAAGPVRPAAIDAPAPAAPAAT